MLPHHVILVIVSLLGFTSCAPSLIEAIQKDDVAKAIALIEAGHDVNDSKDGQTALMLAVYEGHHQVVDKLLDHQASVEVLDEHGRTVLHYAACGSTTSVSLLGDLLPRGADVVNVAEPDRGWTPLHCAARRGNTVSISHLLRAGADRNQRDHMKRTPYDLARVAGHGDRAEAIITKEGRLLKCPRPLAVPPSFGESAAGACSAIATELKHGLKLSASFCQPLYTCVYNQFDPAVCVESYDPEAIRSCEAACPAGVSEAGCREECAHHVWQPLRVSFEACAHSVSMTPL